MRLSKLSKEEECTIVPNEHLAILRRGVTQM
jgi:hypothetical protein